MGFPFETKVLCKLLFVMFLLILAYRLTTSLHHSQQHVDTVSTGALNTRERELEAGCCPTKQHLATARLASPCADMTQLNISSFDESASVFSLTPPFVKNTILQMFLGLLPSLQAVFSVTVKMPSLSVFFSVQPLYLQSSIFHKLAGGAPK